MMASKSYIIDSYFSYLMPWRERTLLKQFLLRQIRLKYRGSVLGIGWCLITPLCQLVIYTLVFKYALRINWIGSTGGGVDFALRMFTGLSVFTFFAECILQAPNLVLEQANLVKKVRFPTEIMNWIILITASTSFLISMCLLLLACVITGIPASFAWFSLPLIWLPLVPLLLGISWTFSSVGVYVRDIGQMLSVLLPLLQFLCPIIYPLAALPVKLQWILYLNPLTLIIEQSRKAIFYGIWPDLILWSYEMIGCLFIALLGIEIHKRLSRGFADVI